MVIALAMSVELCAICARYSSTRSYRLSFLFIRSSRSLAVSFGVSGCDMPRLKLCSRLGLWGSLLMGDDTDGSRTLLNVEVKFLLAPIGVDRAVRSGKLCGDRDRDCDSLPLGV